MDSDETVNAEYMLSFREWQQKHYPFLAERDALMLYLQLHPGRTVGLILELMHTIVRAHELIRALKDKSHLSQQSPN